MRVDGWTYRSLLSFVVGAVPARRSSRRFGGVGTPPNAALAPGVVAVDSKRKTVQHLEGGIVSGILVREGERVVQGQPLVSLEAMKMETVLEAPCDGVVVRVLPAAGSQVVAGEAVVVLGTVDVETGSEIEAQELEEAAV